MKTLIFLLISFQSFAQIDTIQPPCDLTRQQTRLWHDLRKTALKLYDDQHERENTKEIKSLRYGLKYERIERRKDKDGFSYQLDSLKRSNVLELKKERNRHQEAEKALTNEKKEVQADLTIQKRKAQTAQTEARKKPSWNLLIGIVGGIILLFLIIVYKVKKKR